MTAAPTVPATATLDQAHPRQVFCPIEQEHRDLQVANDARAGRFRYAGQTLDLAIPPDWRKDGLVDDEEWGIEWSKFYFGLDLAHAFATTGDVSYLRTWEALVASWIDQQRPDTDSSDVTARRLQNWLYAWQGFDRADGFPGLDAGFRRRLLTSMSEQLDHVRDTLTSERNHRTLELYCLFVVALALPALDPGGHRATQAWLDLQHNLLTDVWTDGVHRERSTHYHLIALRSFVAARINATRFGRSTPPPYDERLRAACRFALHLHRPDGQIPALSDSDSGSYLDLLGLAGQVLDAPDLRYAGSRGRDGIPPTERNAAFPVGGYYVQRSGWGDRGEQQHDERFLILGCGPIGDGGHGHYDALSVEAYGHGRPLVVDPGRYTYAEGSPNWRHWFKGTAAHNTVTVDGLDQLPYRRGKPKGPRYSSRLTELRATEGLHLLRGEVTSPAYDAVHRRTVVFVNEEYWLVFDQLRAASPHEYVVRWHLGPGTSEPTPPEVRPAAGGVSSVTADGLSIDLAGGRPASVEPGWVSVEYGVKVAAPVVTMSSGPGVCDADLVSLLSPRPSRHGARRLVQCDAGAGAAVVETPGGSTDHVVCGGAERHVVAGGLDVAGDTVWLRTDAGGRLQHVAVRRPTVVRWTGSGPAPELLPGPDDWCVWPGPVATS